MPYIAVPRGSSPSSTGPSIACLSEAYSFQPSKRAGEYDRKGPVEIVGSI